VGHAVFICHASEDRDIAIAIVAGLERRGASCWIAPRDIPVGAQYAQAIVSGISGARALVLVFSDSANRSPHVAREVERAVSRGMPVIPVRLGDVEPTPALEYYISDAQWLDVTPATLDSDIDQLSRAVSETVGEAAGGSARGEARDALAQAVARFGPQLVDDARRVEAVLRDLAGESRAEIAALSVAAAEGVGRALLDSSLGTRTGLKVQLARRLESNRALASDMAEWAVETWSEVLGVSDPVADVEPPAVPGTEDVEPTRPVGGEPPGIPAPPPTPPPVPSSEIEAGGTSNRAAAELGATMPAGETAAIPPPPQFPPPTTPPPLDGGAAPTRREPTPAPGSEARRLTGPPAGEKKRGRTAALVLTAVLVLVGFGAIASLIGNDDGTTPTSANAGSTSTTGPTSTTAPSTTTSISPAASGSSSDPFLLPYSESFAEPGGTWETSTLSTESGTRTWDVADGRLILEAETNSSRFYSKLAYFDLPVAYTVAVTASQADSETVACGLSLRDPQAESGFLFTIDATEQEYRVDELAPEASTNSLVPATFDEAIRPGGENLVEVAVNGSDVTFLINGTPVAQHAATDLPVQERIGVAGLVAPGQTERCFFDDLSVIAGVADGAAGGSGTLALPASALGTGWAVHDVDQSQTREGEFPIHCTGGSEASTTVRIDRVESQSFTNEDDGTSAFVLVAESEPDLIDALFGSERANLAFCDAGGGSLRPVTSTTPPDVGTDGLAGRSLLGSTDDTQFALIRVSPTTALYTLLYSPFQEMDPRAGNDFAETVFNMLF
jgi:hypothetical protein